MSDDISQTTNTPNGRTSPTLQRTDGGPDLSGRDKESNARPLPSRKHPVHASVVERFNRTEIILVTVCTKDRRHLLARPEIHDLLCAAWRHGGDWVVGRYVVLPDHVHFFVSPSRPDHEPLKKWVARWKADVTRRWPHREEVPVWQRDFWDRQIRRGEGYSAKWEYVRNNPVRHGLVLSPDDWPYQGEIHPLRWHD